MKSTCVLAAIAGAAAVEQKQTVTPVQKVIVLLGELADQVVDEGKREAASYDKFACFCKEQADDKVYQISKSDAIIEELQAAIDKLTADIAELDEDVSTTKGSVTTEETAASEAKAARETERTTFEEERKKTADAIEAIKGAIASLEGSRDTIRGSASASASAALFSTKQTLVKLGLGKLAEQALAEHEQQPNKYEYRSGDILATLQQLKVTFQAQLAKMDEEEATKAHDHNMVEGARSNQIGFMNKSVAEKEAISSSKSEDKSEKTKLLDEETAARTSDQSFLDELTSSCQAKATAWDQRSKARASEVASITEAEGILKNMGGLYSANKRLANVQVASKPSMQEIRRHRERSSRFQHRALSLLQVKSMQDGIEKVKAKLLQSAKELSSPALAAVAASISTVAGRVSDDHFVKVRGIIKDLISRLEQDAADEATAKSVCDEQMSAAVTSRDEKASEMESLSADIDATKSAIVKLTEEITTLGSEIAELHKALNEITELRNAEKAENTKTISDASEGVTAIDGAIAALKNFYGEAFFLQKGHYEPPNADRSGATVGDLAPETFDETEEYTGKTGESKGIFGLLAIIKSDFERTVSTVTEAEETAESEFTTQKESFEGQIGEKEEMKSDKESEKETKAGDLTTFEDNLKDTTKLHGEVLEELEKLKASCIDGEESWEERKAAREREIEALKQALDILENWKGF